MFMSYMVFMSELIMNISEVYDIMYEYIRSNYENMNYE